MAEIVYKVVRSRRRTLQIIVSDGAVVVRAPIGVPDDVIDRFVRQKNEWIERKLARRDTVFEPIRNGSMILDKGRMYPVRFGAEKDGEEGGGFSFRSQASVKGYFIRTCGGDLLADVERISRLCGSRPEETKLCDLKARWGSCDGRGVIKLNWRLLMLPEELREYVVIHELSHLKYMDHSVCFWNEVKRFCPAYKELRAMLKAYAFLPLLYRQNKK